MKQKINKLINQNDYATKKDLKNLETGLKKEIKSSEKRLEDRFDSKLAKRLTDSQNAFRIEMRHEFSVMKDDILAGMSKFTNLILTAIDPLIKDLETRKQDECR